MQPGSTLSAACKKTCGCWPLRLTSQLPATSNQASREYHVPMIETVAITRDVSPRLAECELTHLERVPIDVERARAQHAAYRRVLSDAGCRIERLPAGADMPDCVFVEDIALVVDELAVITRPGAASRQAEVAGVADALAGYRELRRVEAPATVDGG